MLYTLFSKGRISLEIEAKFHFHLLGQNLKAYKTRKKDQNHQLERIFINL